MVVVAPYSTFNQIWSCGDLDFLPFGPQFFRNTKHSPFCLKKIPSWYTEMDLWLLNCILPKFVPVVTLIFVPQVLRNSEHCPSKCFLMTKCAT